MRNIDEIVVNKVSVNILDRDNDTIVFTDRELELNEETYEYFEKHILKGLKDDEAKTAKFDRDGNVLKNLCEGIFEDEDLFLENCKRISQYFFKCMSNDEKEASGDVAVCMFEGQDGKYLAILKLNFADSYSHFVKETEKGICVAVGKSKTGLPSLGQKPSKAVFIRDIKETNEYDMLIVDKQKDGYFANAFVKCDFKRDNRENTRTFQKVSENFARKAFKDNAQEAEEFRNRITNTLRNEDKVNIESVADNCFDDEKIKNDYKAVLVSEGLKEREVHVDRDWVEKKLKKKKLKVDKSIELFIDNDVYNDKDKFQIKTNGDGTIDIILKNVKNYIEK